MTESIEPAINAFKMYTEAIERNSKVITEVARIRREAIIEARKTMSVKDIAAALGVTRGRIYQILNHD